MSQSLTRSPKLAAAQKWFDAGVAEVSQFKQAWQRTREKAMNAGFLFMKAREACPEGEWGFLLDGNAQTMRPRTVRFFIELAEAAVEWVRQLMPEVPPSKIQGVATKEIMMLSPKPLVALLRDLREMRPFGEYDEVKYALRKQGNGQLELDFQKVWSPLDALEHLDQANFSLIPPEGKSETEALRELGLKLARISEKVKGRLLTIEV